MVFPYDFGFIPNTKASDGDPLDVLVLSDLQSFPGCIMECRLIGGFKAEQSDDNNKNKMIRNDRLIAIPQQSTIYQTIKSLNDLPDETLKHLQAFFINYNKIIHRQFNVLSKISSSSVMNLVKKQSLNILLENNK